MDTITKNWDYAELSKAAKAAVGASLLTAATIKIVDYFKSRKTNNLEIEIAKEELIKGIKEYDAAHPDEEGGNEDE